MADLKFSVINFTKSINLQGGTITYKRLLKAISRKGFVVKEYSESAILLMTLGIYDESKEADSTSAVDKSGVAYIFIDDNIPMEHRLFTLAHEIGHIILKHRKTQSLKRQQEREADLFAHYLLSGRNNRNLSIMFNALSLFLCAFTIIAATNLKLPAKERVKTVSNEAESFAWSSEEDFENICYFTKYGEVYHIYNDCQYIRSSKYVYSDTIEHSHKDRLCSACERRKNNE